jgi:hypothetical protein
MLLAKRSTSRFNQDTDWEGYSKPAPGPLILNIAFAFIEREERRSIERGRVGESLERVGFNMVVGLPRGVEE